MGSSPGKWAHIRLFEGIHVSTKKSEKGKYKGNITIDGMKLETYRSLKDCTIRLVYTLKGL